MTCILVTGGPGFIGRNLVLGLRAVGHQIPAPARGALELADDPAARSAVGSHGHADV